MSATETKRSLPKAIPVAQMPERAGTRSDGARYQRRAEMRALDAAMGAAIRREIHAQGFELPSTIDWREVGTALRSAIIRHVLVGE